MQALGWNLPCGSPDLGIVVFTENGRLQGYGVMEQPQVNEWQNVSPTCAVQPRIPSQFSWDSVTRRVSAQTCPNHPPFLAPDLS